MSIVCSRVKKRETMNFHWIFGEAAFLGRKENIYFIDYLSNWIKNLSKYKNLVGHVMESA